MLQIWIIWCTILVDKISQSILLDQNISRNTKAKPIYINFSRGLCVHLRFWFFFFFWDEGFDSILMELKKTPSNYRCGQVKPWITPWTQFNSISIKRSETHVLQPQNTKKNTSDSIMRKLALFSIEKERKENNLQSICPSRCNFYNFRHTTTGVELKYLEDRSTTIL